jgi:RNA recognition motif-containing protein
MKLFVRNITFEATSADLQLFFKVQGYGAVDCKIIVSPEDGRSRGFGFVTFLDAGAYERALHDLEGCEFMGRALHVAPAHDKPRGSSRGRDRKTGNNRDEGTRQGSRENFGWEDV